MPDTSAGDVFDAARSAGDRIVAAGVEGSMLDSQEVTNSISEDGPGAESNTRMPSPEVGDGFGDESAGDAQDATTRALEAGLDATDAPASDSQDPTMISLGSGIDDPGSDAQALEGSAGAGSQLTPALIVESVQPDLF
jgi:hypothetical protein